jgi:hypothetical protein
MNDDSLFDAACREVGRRLLAGILAGASVLCFGLLALLSFWLWQAGSWTIPSIIFYRIWSASVAALILGLAPEILWLFKAPAMAANMIRQAHQRRVEALLLDAKQQAARRRNDEFQRRLLGMDQDRTETNQDKNATNTETPARLDQGFCLGATTTETVNDFNGLCPKVSRDTGKQEHKKKEEKSPVFDPVTVSQDTPAHGVRFDSPEQQQAYSMRLAGASWSAICRELFGSANGRRIAKAKKLLAKFNMV